ncbi:MAG: DUF4340 domain-containing protein, partial [Deltaproteobacteria bacterium]|nr:DUF4340 domain-containing protein [Deltaproteobacteria bacterium]
EKWVMLKPEKMRIKGADVSRNLINLTNLQAKDIIDESPKDDDPYGLNSPSDSILLEGKNRTQTLLVGKAKDEKDKTPHSKPDRYARIEGQDMIHVIASRTLDDFTTDPDKLRDRYLMAFKPHEVEKLQVDLDGTTWVAVKSKDDKWTLEKPTQKDNIESWPVTGILWDLKNLEWKDMKIPAPDDLSTVYLDKPRLTVSVAKKGDTEPLTLKAGWKAGSPQKAEPSAEQKPQGALADESAQAARDSGTGEKSPEKEKAASESAQGAKIPELVNAMAQPHEEGNPLFMVESSFIERLRKDLQRLSGETKN